MQGLTDKVALVTGGGRGIGRAMCIRLAQEGVDIVAADIDANLAQETASKVAALGAHHINVSAVCPGSTVTDMHMTVTHALAERQNISVE